MADVATPSAAAISTMNAGAEPSKTDSPKAPSASTKPEKPDEAAFKAAEEAKDKELKAAQAKAKEADEKFNASKPSNKDSPNAQRQAELKKELSEIRTKQQGGKNAKSGVQERISQLDTQLKAKFNEQKAAKARLPFKNVEEIDQQISTLTKEVESGRMRIVDEKKNLSEISGLNKQKKEFAGLDNIQKSIDTIKASIATTKKELENPEMRALSAEYDQKQAELNTLKAEQDSVYKNRDASRETLTAAKAVVTRIFGELKALRDEYYGARRAFVAWDRESKQQYFAKKKAENEARDLEKKKRSMEEDLEQAQEPAYLDEIHACDQLIRIIDPSALPSKASTAASKFAATAQRTVDTGEMKGTRLSKKDDEEYFAGTGGKKKKGRKGQQDGTATPTKVVDVGLFFTPGVAEHFEKIGVRQPSSAEDQPRVLEEIKSKRKFYEENQDEKTKENIAAVQRKFDRLESAGAKAAPQTNGTDATDSPQVNGGAQESAKPVPDKSTDGTNDISETLRKTEVSDGKAEESAEAVTEAEKEEDKE